jgi:far upstream element-binding protein
LTTEPPAKVARKTDNVGESDVTQDVEAEDAEPDSSSEKKQDGTSNAVPPQADTADDFAAAADDFAAAKPEGKEDDDSENDPEPASAADSDPACASTSEPEVTDGDAEESEPQANVPSFEETGGVSGLPPGALSELPDAPVNPAQAATVLNPESIVEERAELATELVGRVIGKGGEMIRDLQARSGCRVDVDQNVPADSPKIITYRGTRRAVNLAKELVETLCSQEGKRDTDLPLGMATRRQLIVPSSSIGKIIGRGGEMIRDLQNRSKGKIQVDHTGEGVTDPSTRRLTVTGTQEAVTKAEEMIMFLVANPQMDAAQAIDMLVDDKTRGGGTWGSGPPYTNLPNQGQGMQVGPGYGGGGHAAAQYGGGEGGGYAAPYGGGGYAAQYGGSGYAAPYGGGGYAAPYGGGGYAAPYGGGGYQQTPGAYGGSAAAGTEVEIFYAAKMYMGRLIGSRGVTINDVQKQSGCDIQINQDVPPGQDCEISIKGSRQGIEMAKGMLRDIIEMGPDHPYAGGTGGGARTFPYLSWFAAKLTANTHFMCRRFIFHHSTASQLWRGRISSTWQL